MLESVCVNSTTGPFVCCQLSSLMVPSLSCAVAVIVTDSFCIASSGPAKVTLGALFNCVISTVALLCTVPPALSVTVTLKPSVSFSLTFGAVKLNSPSIWLNSMEEPADCTHTMALIVPSMSCALAIKLTWVLASALLGPVILTVGGVF